MAGDASWGSNSLLLHLNGSNGSTAFPDTSPSARVVTAFGNAQISTAQSKFGGASLALDGTGGYVSVPSSADFNLSANSTYTWEFFIRFASLAGDPYLINLAGDNNQNRVAVQYSSAAGRLDVYRAISGASATVSTGALGLVINTWYHVAWVLIAGTTKLFVEGVPVYSGAFTYPNVSSVCNIGAANPVASSNYLNGFIGEFRSKNGQALYTGAFTPPTEPFADGVAQVSGVVRDSTAALVQRTVRAYRRDTGALVASALSDAATGVYSFYTPTLDEVSVICLDDAAGTLENDLIHRVIPA